MPNASLPLLQPGDGSRVIAWRDGVAIDARTFLHDVQRLVATMPDATAVLNVCQDRYRFTVGFAAAAVSGRVSLMPSTRTPQTITQLRHLAPDLLCLHDQPCDLDLPKLAYPTANPGLGAGAMAHAAMPCIAADRVVAQVFTSGSTGQPIPHPKTWGALAHCVRRGVAELGLAPGTSLVGTVPPQHMYGFESTVLVALQAGLAMSATHPFYPADIADALAGIPMPRVLVTTPVHLRALLDSGIGLPALATVLCATAPLDPALAGRAEQAYGAPVLEIYGSTETGQIASRRPTQTEAWRLFEDVMLCPRPDGTATARGGHVAGEVPVQDLIEVLDRPHFRLQGRSSDMVNIAGKRSSLAHLDQQLCAIAGVRDGAFHLPEGGPGRRSVARLMAFAVAPGLCAEQILLLLRERVDPAFMPRPLVLLDALPRNASGKLPRSVLAELADRHLPAAEVTDAGTH
jgi:acyl-coenzyme A synthetase/AMP-(fatty) acid ligase